MSVVTFNVTMLAPPALTVTRRLVPMKFVEFTNTAEGALGVAGTVAVRLTTPAKPPMLWTVMMEVPKDFGLIVREDGFAVMVKDGGAP